MENYCKKIIYIFNIYICEMSFFFYIFNMSKEDFNMILLYFDSKNVLQRKFFYEVF